MSTTKKDQSDERYIGHLDQLKELIAIYKINELIFCSSSLSISEIIYQMAELSADNVDFKIAPNESNAIIGSNSITHSSNLYIIDIDGITKSKNKRTKRIFDFIVSTLLLISYPITGWFISRKASYFRNLISVVVGNKSIIGYDNSTFSKSVKLPSIKEGILFPRDAFDQNEITEEVSTRLNIIYAKDYKLNNDFKILVKGFRFLGR